MNIIKIMIKHNHKTLQAPDLQRSEKAAEKRKANFANRKILSYSFLLKPVLDKNNRSFLELAIRRYVNWLEYLIRHKGERVALAQAKSIQNDLKRLALGLPPSHKNAVWCRTDKAGFPKRLASLRRFILSKNPVMKGMGLTIANIYRIFEIEPEEDISSIVGGFTGTNPNVPSEIIRYLDGFVENLNVPVKESLPPIFPRGDLYPSLFTKGVHQSPNILTSSFDAQILLGGDHPDELNAVTVMLHRWNASFILREARSVMEFITPLKNVRKKTNDLGRLVFIPDKGGKSRSVTMGNYYIQASLRPLHDELMSALKSLPYDFTYRTRDVSKHIQMMFAKGYKAFCFDMSSATDRFPKAFQGDVLDRIYGHEVASAWSTLMSMPLEFHNKSIRFEVGQPMGLLSSFPAFALSHHFLVQSCYLQSGLTPTYMVIGDDVVLFLDQESMHKDINPCTLYVDYLATLGVGIAAHKNVLSCDDAFVAEFTKRIFHGNHEITPLGPGLLALETMSVNRVASIVLHLVNTWRETSNVRLERSVLTLLNRLSPPSQRNAYVFKFLMEYGDALPQFLVERLLVEIGLPGLDLESLKPLFILFRSRNPNRFYNSVDLLKLVKRFERIGRSGDWKKAHPVMQKAGLEFNKLQDMYSHYYDSVTSCFNKSCPVVSIADAANQVFDLRVQYLVCKSYLSLIEKGSFEAGFSENEKPTSYGNFLQYLRGLNYLSDFQLPPSKGGPDKDKLIITLGSVAKVLADRRIGFSRYDLKV